MNLGRVLDAYEHGISESSRVAALTAATRSRDGLLNDTFVLPRCVVQRVNPIFGAAVNTDIAALTTVLRAAGVPVPTLLPTRDNKPCVVLEGGDEAGVWRVQTRIFGRTIHRTTCEQQVVNAARAVAEFHSALLDSDHQFQFSRGYVHDTPRHVSALEAALRAHPDHRLFAQVATLARLVLERWPQVRSEAELPKRIVHGDPKISNFLFDDQDHIAGVIDLDTIARAPIDGEIGDAVRSWCNLATEDEPANFDPKRAGLAISTYVDAASSWIEPTERASLAAAPERITLELTARFAADALNESYFGWDADRFATRGEHNLARALGQWQLASQMRAASPSLAKSLPATTPLGKR